MTEKTPEKLNPETIFNQPPSSAEQLLPPSAKLQLYNMYTERIGELPGFRQRPFADAQADFSATLHDQDDSLDIEAKRNLIYNLITPESYDKFTTYLASYWTHHKIEEELSSYSYLILGGHFAFSDIPIEATAVQDIRKRDPYAVMRNVQVVGKMIPGMEVDLFANGGYLPVTPLLKYVGRQVQTVPKIPHNASAEAKSQREVWNSEAKHVLGEITSTPGNITYLAGSSSQDIPSGNKLIMQSMNPETAKLLCHPQLKIIRLFFMCDSFSSGKLAPAEARFAMQPPKVLTKPDEAYEFMQDIAKLGTQITRDLFPGGVEYESKFKRAGRLVTKHLSGGASDDTEIQY